LVTKKLSFRAVSDARGIDSVMHMVSAPENSLGEIEETFFFPVQPRKSIAFQRSSQT
jgi:hypothetical protein